MEDKISWKDNYSTLAEYYSDKYDAEHFEFDKYDITVDPDETIEALDAYTPEQQRREYIKCTLSFSYFCSKFVKIVHPKEGLVRFILFKYQKKVIEDYEDNRFNIIRKFRQGGLTTVTVIWAMWRCLFRENETIMVVSKSDREAIAAGEIVKRALEELPIWMKPSMDKNNDHQKIFEGTGCKLFFYTVEAARGRSFTYLIIDEAAFIPGMEKHWNGLYPTLATGGGGIVISTVNGVGNWYYETWEKAKKKKNPFHIIDLHYTEHPIYKDKDWVKQTKAQLGEKGWRQEIEGDFLGSGDTYIPPDIIAELFEKASQFEPIRLLFPEWNNIEEDSGDETRIDWGRGALQIFKEPIEGREYIMGVDAAEGIGEDGDNSCFEVIDQITCEQVAEFYSNTVQPHVFAQIISQVGRYYNNALVVVENLGAGMTVVSKLEHEVFYENIYHEISGKNERIGIKTNRSNRPVFLEAMQSKLIGRTMLIKSNRFLQELKRLVYNKQTKRIEAQKGYHDDAIMAMALALYIRDTIVRSVPAAPDVPEEFTDEFKTRIFQEIKNELEKGAPEEWLRPISRTQDLLERSQEEETMLALIAGRVKRKHDSLLKEFGW